MKTKAQEMLDFLNEDKHEQKLGDSLVFFDIKDLTFLSKDILEIEEGFADTWDSKWTPPEGLSDKKAGTIAKIIAATGKTLKNATDKLNFFINRAGNKMDPDKLIKMKRVLDILSDMKKFKKKK